ncbi:MULTISPECIES: SDR family NAD(P)-dependent oxidoreductase [unclassified Pseudofrankia]|uniref:SDR family NAD(P)-dependent oxidoreductase n=1 Tax=unclassified Pseudofrankia TaxID=2994372 RepID=UPI0008DA68B1|nr:MULTISPECIES: SDR family oxidoreductase [unclassified Pseudofrankia]MDT3442936.1 SDR family oxidoreductase [Pseudofrankia sp. BMG5.37]OHV42974.1 short-chain dehydrogenase [Pseudofrankia sp. BMG5.36]
MGRLEGKVAVVTGGANNIGLAIATRMADEGATIAILDLDDAAAYAAAGKLGGANTSFACDVTDESQVAATLAAIADRHNRLDVLVNNAGIEGRNKPTHELELADWERVMAVNATAVFLCTKHAIPHLKRSSAGSIINISSIYGLVGGGDIPPYHASKGAVRLMSKNDALTYAPDNIRVNSIHPGFIFTDMVIRYATDSGLPLDDARIALNAAHPLNGTGDPDDVAWGAVYLASDQAKWVTGSELVIDGGYTAR